MANCSPVHISGIDNDLMAEPEASIPLSKEGTIEFRRSMGPIISSCQCSCADIHSLHGVRQAHIALPSEHTRCLQHLQ